MISMADSQKVLLLAYAPHVSMAHLKGLWHTSVLVAAGFQLLTSFTSK